jgi:AraC family transcriptional regulator of adaptative response/methylated-DNA-[protein]-cysteine methyltransferase
MGSRILFRDLTSPVGDMIAGATEHGVCFLEWHSRGGIDRILERVQKRYRMPLVAGDSEHLTLLQRELGDYFAGILRQFTVPLDVTGTEFERSVWAQLLQIPYGETRSYNNIAEAIGRPKACRAVGRANGANYASILIPCHRVIESGGGLRGYGGGLWRKQFLLELERKVLRGQAASGVEGVLAGASTELLEILAG